MLLSLNVQLLTVGRAWNIVTAAQLLSLAPVKTRCSMTVSMPSPLKLMTVVLAQ